MNMYDKTFVLSPSIFFPSFQEFVNNNPDVEDFPERQSLAQESLFFLYNEKTDKLFLIKPIIKVFLEAFTTPITLRAVIVDFAKQANCDPRDILDKTSTFFDNMYKHNFLLDIKKLSKTASKDKNPNEINTKKQNTFEIGQILGEQYKISKTLSIRSKTELYLAEDTKNQTTVVVKTLREYEHWKEKYRTKKRSQFKQEFSLLQELKDHPSICQLITYHESETQVYAVMEYIEGESVKKFLKKTTCSFPQKEQLLGNILEVMTYVQDKEIIHGDLHSSNFMIKEDFSVKLIDFDLANHAVPKENEVIRNGGVHQYIPPERVSLKAFSFVKKPADFRAEIFQIGVLMYYIIYEKFPFTAFTWQGLADTILNKTPDYPKLSPQGDPIPSKWIQTIQKALAKDPEARFASTKAMCQAINNSFG